MSEKQVDLDSANTAVDIETNVRLSDSKIWELSRSFHQEKGPSAFQLIPYKVTNNALLVSAMVDLVIAFFADYRDKIDLNEPLQIIELGSGSGCFGYRFLSMLLSRLSLLSNLRGLKLRYLMTDFADSNVESWKRKNVLQKFILDGTLQLATLNIETDIDGSLFKSPNPTIVIANYVLDSLPPDAFHVADGELFEYLYTTSSQRDSENLDTKPELDDFAFSTSTTEITADRFEDHRLMEVLSTYKTQSGLSFSFPTGALRLISRLMDGTANNFAFIGADWGDVTEFRPNSVYPIHHTTVSVGVNFDAVKKFVELCGGSCDLMQMRDINMFAISFVDASNREPSFMRYQMQDRIATQCPSDLFSFLYQLIDANWNAEFLRLPLLLRTLQSCEFDSEIFLLFVNRFFDPIAKELDQLTSQLDIDRVNDYLERVMKNVYPFTGKDVSYKITKDPYENIVNVWKACREANFALDTQLAIMRNFYRNAKEAEGLKESG